MSKKIIDKRKYPRFYFTRTSGPFAVTGPDSRRLGQITDISMGGLAFCYIYDGKDWNNHSIRFDILFDEEEFDCRQIPLITVSDILVKKSYPHNPLCMRRRGLQFGELTTRQQQILREFISIHFPDVPGAMHLSA